MKFIETQNILYTKQFGFRQKYSTTQALLSITNKIQKAVDDGTYSCGIFLDFSKAFDTVNHNILIMKLDHYGFRGIVKKWFCSYLNERKQFVSIGNAISNYKQISCGVPQGSVLGPLLFLLYINDFNNSSNQLDFHLFADDSNLFYAHKSLSELETTVNNELQEVFSWLCANKLSLNIEKSNYVIFRPPQKSVNYSINLKINNQTLMHENSIKYLGIMIDSHLNWKSQVCYISKKIKRNIGILSKIRHYVNLKTLTNLYYSLTYPFLIYGITAWGNTYKSTLTPIITLQKRVLRIITFSNYNDHSIPLFKAIEIIKFEDIIFLHNAIFMCDFHSGTLPPAFSNYFTAVNKRHKYNTRLASKSSFVLPQIRTNYGKFSIKFQGAKIWNSLSEETKSLHRLAFKKTLKRKSYSPIDIH